MSNSLPVLSRRQSFFPSIDIAGATWAQLNSLTVRNMRVTVPMKISTIAFFLGSVMSLVPFQEDCNAVHWYDQTTTQAQWGIGCFLKLPTPGIEPWICQSRIFILFHQAICSKTACWSIGASQCYIHHLVMQLSQICYYTELEYVHGYPRVFDFPST